MRKVISNQDGSSGRRAETFASQCPCSYRIEEAGEVVGFIFPIRHYDLGNVWQVTINGKSESFQYFADAKNFAKGEV